MREIINTLRSEMQKSSTDYVIVTSYDDNLSEYPHEHYALREKISGFTGSNGTLLVGDSEAYLYTDSRYFLQAEAELSGSGITMKKSRGDGIYEIALFLKECSNDAKVAIDTRTISAEEFSFLRRNTASCNVTLMHDDIAFRVCKDMPHLPSNPIIIMGENAGEKASEKIEKIREVMKESGADSHIITTLPDIAWILNLRGNDVEYNPLFYSYLIMGMNYIYLYICEEAVSAETEDYLNGLGVTLKNFESFYGDVTELASGFTDIDFNFVMVDTSKINQRLYEILENKVRIISHSNPSLMMKALKNDVETDGFRKANVLDGVAMVNFIYHIKNKRRDEDELSAARKLWALREKVGAISPSFETISAYGSHGAIVHYSADNSSSVKLEDKGFYLVDSGAHYEGGTTDITRTIALGKLSYEEKLHYTLVLKGMIDLATAVFPQGTKGSQLDILARKHLWKEGLDFGHGTGHGIGHRLCVHEGPVNISPRANCVFEKGMVCSDEPGVYLEGRYGIRLENDLLCVETGEGFLGFETLTLCPFENDAILVSMLTDEEKNYLRDYNNEVYEKLAPHLDEEVREWLLSVLTVPFV